MSPKVHLGITSNSMGIRLLGFIEGTKYFKTSNGIQVVLKESTFLVEAQQKVGILSGIGEGKSTVINVLAGTEKLNQGQLIKNHSTWLLGYSGAFHPFLSAAENINIIALLNHLDPLELRMYCQDFAQLSNEELHLKMSAFSANMRAKLGFALSLAIPCDFLLADEKLSFGNEDFRIKCEAALELKLKQTGLIFFSRNPKLTQRICNQHGLLHNGKITLYDSHEETCYHFKQDKL